MTKDEIVAEMERILDKNDHWKSCQDGSYEMALDMDGYYKLKEELKKMKETS